MLRLPSAFACAKAFALLIVFGCPLVTIETNTAKTSYGAADGALALARMRWANPGPSASAALDALSYPSAFAREVIRKAKCAYKGTKACEGASKAFVMPALDQGTKKAATTSRALTRAFGEETFREFATACVLALVGAVKFSFTGDIGSFGALSSIALVYSTNAHGNETVATARVAWVVVALGALSSPIVNNILAFGRRKVEKRD